VLVRVFHFTTAAEYPVAGKMTQCIDVGAYVSSKRYGISRRATPDGMGSVLF
jgi:hypothetical protein